MTLSTILRKKASLENRNSHFKRKNLRLSTVARDGYGRAMAVTESELKQTCLDFLSAVVRGKAKRPSALRTQTAIDCLTELRDAEVEKKERLQDFVVDMVRETAL